MDKKIAYVTNVKDYAGPAAASALVADVGQFFAMTNLLPMLMQLIHTLLPMKGLSFQSKLMP